MTERTRRRAKPTQRTSPRADTGTAPWSLSDLEFLRSGIGIVHATAEGPAQTCYVSRSADDRQSC